MGLLTCLATILTGSQLSANCLLLHDASQHSHWVWHVSTDVHFSNLESTDVYFSGDGTEDWRAEHDLDGPLYGLTMTGSPPVLGNMIRGFVSYREGDLDGDFNTREIDPVPEGPYPGDVSFDREELELGIDVQILNAVYARVAYSKHEMDGDWEYDGPSDPIEPQEYDFEAVEVGAGFRQDYVSCYSPDLTFGVDTYLAVLFFDYEHTEVDGGYRKDTDGAGFKGRIEANFKYLVADHARVMLACGYAYQDLDKDDLDLTQEGFLLRLGVEAEF